MVYIIDMNVKDTVAFFLPPNNGGIPPANVFFIYFPATTLTIVDDDFSGGEFVFDSPVYTVNEYEATATITVLRTNGSSGIVSVQFATLNGTAQAGLDYYSTNGVLAFADGETTRTFSVPIIPDYIDETNETVVLVLSSPTGGGSLGVTRTATL